MLSLLRLPCSHLYVGDCLARELVSVRGEADGVGGAGVVDDGGDGEEALDVHLGV